MLTPFSVVEDRRSAASEIYVLRVLCIYLSVPKSENVLRKKHFESVEEVKQQPQIH